MNSIGNSYSMQYNMREINYKNSFYFKTQVFMNMLNLEESWDHIEKYDFKSHKNEDEPHYFNIK